MSSCTHAMIVGINTKLAELGEVAWPDEKVASEVCFQIAQSLDGPDTLPAEGLSKESALMIAQLLKEANEAMVADGGITEQGAEDYLAKTASAARDLDALAADVAGECMLKAASDALLETPGDSGENSLAAAAAAGDALARLDQKNRPAGSYNAGLGQTAMPVDVGQVGTVMPHPSGPDMGDVPNSLDIKMAQLRAVIEHIKTAGKSKALDGLMDAVGKGKKGGRAAWEAAKKSGKGGGGGKGSDFLKRHGGALAAGAAGVVAGGAAGYAAGRSGSEKDATIHVSPGDATKVVEKGLATRNVGLAKRTIMDKLKDKKKGIAAGLAAAGAGFGAGYAATHKGESDKEASVAERVRRAKSPVSRAMDAVKKNKGALGVAGASAAGAAVGAAVGSATSKKEASYAEVVMRGFQKVAAEQLLTDALVELKVASVDELDPDQLRALADYIEQNVSQQSDSVDLSHLDPQLLAALHAQGSAPDEEDEGGDEPPVPGAPPKTAFAVTDAGHQLDASHYRRIADALHGMSQDSQRYTDEQPLLSHFTGEQMNALMNKLVSRHYDYAARKHEQGSNAWNPYGGMLTQSRQEQAAKRGSVLDRIKRAAAGGMAGETADNTLNAAAASGDAVAKLDKKNRPEGSYDAGLGASNFPNVGQVGHSEVVEPRENPKNTVTTELKSASLTDEEKAYVGQVQKMAQLYGDQLPSTLERGEKIAALKELVGLSPADRKVFIEALRG